LQLKTASELKVPETVEKVRGGKEPLLPLPGMIAGTETIYYGNKTAKFNLESYETRRILMPTYLTEKNSDKEIPETDPRYGERLSETLFHLSLQWTQGGENNKQWDLKILHIISLYVVPNFFVVDNFITLPANPMDALFEIRYYKQGNPQDDLLKCGYTERRVSAEPYLERHAKRQAELEAADDKKEPICSDEQWIGFWSKKMKVKEEMYRAMKQRVLYGEAYEGLYEEGNEVAEEEDYEQYDDYAEF